MSVRISRPYVGRHGGLPVTTVGEVVVGEGPGDLGAEVARRGVHPERAAQRACGQRLLWTASSGEGLRFEGGAVRVSALAEQRHHLRLGDLVPGGQPQACEP